jgi:hypothetical protein
MCKDKIPRKIDGGFYRYKSRGLIGHKRERKGIKGERRGIKGSGREKRDECFCEGVSNRARSQFVVPSFWKEGSGVVETNKVRPFLNV